MMQMLTICSFIAGFDGANDKTKHHDTICPCTFCTLKDMKDNKLHKF